MFKSPFLHSFSDADPPVSYDLIFIDKSDKQMQKKSNQNQVFKLSTQTTSPTSDEDSIAKVLDWFSRSTDSSEWLNTEDGPEVATGSNKHVEISKLRGEDSFRKDAGDVVSDRQKESLEMKRSHSQKQSSDAKESSRTDRTGNKEVAETQEEVAKRNRERMRSQEFEDNNDESQPPQISHLKSFWEKSNVGPKILISNSIMPSNKGQKPAQLSAEKDEEKVNKPHGVSDMPSVPGLYNGKGSYGDERGQQLVISPQKDTGDSVHLNRNQEGFMTDTPTQRNSKLAVSAHVVDRRGSENDILGISRLSPLQRNAVQSRLSPESESVKPNPQADSISQYRETPLQDELPKTTSTTTTQLDTDLQTRDSPDSEMLYLSRNSPYLDYKQGDIQITPKTQVRRGSNEDARRRDSEDRSMQPGMSPKRKEDMSTKDRINSPQSNRRGVTNQESTAERIKQLRSFWEQERNKPMFYTGKPRTLGDGKVARGANQAKLNKRFTKSEYDLTSIGNNSGSDEEDYDRNFNVLPLNQRIEKSSPSLGASRAQFNTLREFWDEATSDTKGSFTIDKPKSPKRKEPISAQLSSQELKCGDPEIYREKTRQAAKSSPQNRSKSPHDRQSGSRAANDSKNNQSNYTTAEQQRESRRSSKDSTKPQSSSGKETRAPKGKKDSFSYSSSRGHSLRRATSMFALSEPEERDLSPFKVDVSPVHSQSRKQRQNTEKGTTSRRSTEETEPLTLRARSCVPRDYRHYLGMTDATSVHTSLAPALKDEESDGKSGYEFDLGGPVRASTPVSSEDRYGRKGNKTNQRPLWTNYSSSDTGLESSVSSTSETWSTSRTSSNREHQLQIFYSLTQIT